MHGVYHNGFEFGKSESQKLYYLTRATRKSRFCITKKKGEKYGI